MFNDEFSDKELSKDQKYYRRHLEKVAEKNRIYNEKNKDKYNEIRRLNAKMYWDQHKEEILSKRKEKRNA